MINIQMLQSEFERLQPIISTLFDIPSININQSTQANQILQITIQYAHKLIQITQKIDQFRHRTATSHQAQVYNTILSVFTQCGYREEEHLSQIQMLEMIETDIKRKAQMLKQSKNTKRMSSRSETKRSKKEPEISKKEITFIKQGFKKQESYWKQIYLKIDTISQKHLNQKRFIAEPMLKQEGISFYEMLKENIGFNSYHLSNLTKFMDTLIQYLPSAKNNKVAQLLSEIEQRQNVFSYSISRLMQSIRTLKNPTNRNPQQTYENITTLISKLFDIYPNSQLLKSLELKDQSTKKYNPNIKEYLNNCKQTQCNIKVETKKEIELKNLSLNFYRYRTRIQQNLKKLEGSLKFKKVQIKQLERITDQLKQVAVWNENQDYQQIRSFEEELMKMTSIYEKKQAEVKDQYNKSLKKAQKSLQAYEGQLKLLKSQINNNQNTSQKLAKKLDIEKSEKQKLKERCNQLTKVIQALQSQLQKSKSSLKSQHKQQLREQKLLRVQYDNILKQKKQNQQQLWTLVQKLKQSQRLFEQERGSFIAKVKMMETKYQHTLYQNTETKQCLEQMITDNKILKDKLEQFATIHQQKIHQCQLVASQYSSVQKQLNHTKVEMKQLKLTLQSSKSLILDLQKQLLEATQNIQNFVKQKQSLLSQCYRYKQLGKLNQDDVEELKVEFEKVHKSYRDVQGQNSYLKQNLQEVIMQHNKVVEIQERCNSTITEMECQVKRLKKQIIEFEQQNKFLKQEVKLKENHFAQLLNNAQVSKEQKKQITKLKRQVSELRNSLTTSELQYNVTKQQLQNHIQEQQSKKSIQKLEIKSVSSKYQLQIESLRMELKSKGDVWEKEKKGYQREKTLNSHKIEELERLLEEKESLTNRIKGFKL